MVCLIPLNLFVGWLLSLYEDAMHVLGNFWILGLLAIVLVEAAVLKWLKWESLPKSFLASLVMNSVSTVIGYGLAFLMAAMLLPKLVEFTVAWALSIAIEGSILMISKRKAHRTSWTAALLANSVSYILLIALALMVGWL
jgi:hypothetical protein